MVTARSAAVGAIAAALAFGGETPVGAALRDWSKALAEVADITSLSSSPDGRYVLFRVDRGDASANTYRLHWQLLDTRTGAVHDIGSGGRPVYDTPGFLRTEQPIWSPDGRAAFLRVLDEAGRIGIWRVVPGSRSLEPLLIHGANPEKLRLAENGQALAYETGPSREEVEQAEQAEYHAGVRIGETVDLGQALVRGGSVDGRLATQRMVGHWYVRAPLLWQAPRQQHRYSFATGRSVPVGDPVPVPDFVPPALSAVARAERGSEIADAQWSAGKGSLEVRSGTRRLRCTHRLCRTLRVGWLHWRPGSRDLLIGFQDRLLQQTVARWSPQSGRLQVLATSEGILSGGRTGRDPCSASRNALFCVEAAAARPPRLVRIDLASGRLSPLYDPNPGWRTAYRPQVVPLKVDLPSGEFATGWLLAPAGAGKNAPLFVNYYRCDGFLRGGEGDEWPLPSLLEAGFAVACLNGVPQAGAQDGLRSYKTGQAVVRSLIRRLAADGTIDPGRVGMGGFSFGSEIAMWIAAETDLLKAVSIASAQLEPSNYWYTALLGTKAKGLLKAVWGLGPPDESAEAWRRMTPARHVRAGWPAVLLQLPEQEARLVPELVVRLREAGVPLELYGFPDEDHIKVQPVHRLAVYRRNADWLRYWLQDFKDPDSGKAAQYRRWDAMRESRAGGSAAAPPAQSAEGTLKP